jgi:K+-transporting ATPase KdpF subunit
MISIIILNVSNSMEINTPDSYFVGGLIALFVFGYLIYSLVRPEKF